MALFALVQWAVRQAATEGHLPPIAAALMSQILTAHSDDRALAVIGSALTPLRLYAMPWYTDHQNVLLDITASMAPIRTWLRCLRRLSEYDCAVLGDLDSVKTGHYLRTDAPQQVFDRFAIALLHSPGTFSPTFLAEVADGAGGPEAVSALLGDIARALPPDSGKSGLHERGFAFWDQALSLAAGTSGVHLRGAGHFAFAQGLDQDQWLRHTLRSVAINPDISFPDQIAARAARTPHRPEARQILTHLLPLVDRSLESRTDYRMLAVVQHARTVLDASESGSEGRAALGKALALHADDVEAATAE
ncbi:hypothetical protein ACFYXP_31950 [Streptomyces sp. NPDC002466]|uniref:hypothetical protein n=1 Tax=Streptomyces sp. NPDC002466 TaxID=3364646 RepID=UPI0036A83275